MGNFRGYLVLFLFFMCMALSSARAQEPSPMIPVLKTKEDHISYNDEVLIIINWLETHSLNAANRDGYQRNFLIWVTGSPSVNVSISSLATELSAKNSDLLFLFIAGWSEYALKNPDEKITPLKGTMEGMNSALDYYQNGKDFGVKKDKNVEKLLKLREQGKLKSYVKKTLDDAGLE